jgi:hypothetical protein
VRPRGTSVDRPATFVLACRGDCFPSKALLSPGGRSFRRCEVDATASRSRVKRGRSFVSDREFGRCCVFCLGRCGRSGLRKRSPRCESGSPGVKVRAAASWLR